MDVPKCRVGKTSAGETALVERKMGSIAAVCQQYMDAGIIRRFDAV